MIKKIIFYLWIIVITGICVFSLYLMYDSDTDYNVSINREEISKDTSDDEIYTAGTGDVVKKIAVTGSVSSGSKNEKLEVAVEGKKADIRCYVKEGGIVEKDEVYAEYRGVQYKAGNRLRCISITEDETGLYFVFLDYSKLEINLYLPEEYADDSLLDTEIEVSCNRQSITGKIKSIDSYCTDGRVMLGVDYNNEEILLRHGSKCKAELTVEEKKNVIAIPLYYVIYTDEYDEYSVRISENGRIENRKIEIGLIGNDMAEIISGLNEAEAIMLPDYEMTLKKYLDSKAEE